MGSDPTRNRKFLKKWKKVQKLKIYIYIYIMASFKPRQDGKGRERKKKKKSFRWVPTRPVIENYKKIVTKFKKLENTVIASFQAKISWERPRKRENK